MNRNNHQSRTRGLREDEVYEATMLSKFSQDETVDKSFLISSTLRKG
jgi:hypothetical protein